MRSGTEGDRDWELLIVTGIAIFAGICLAGFCAAISYSHMLDWARANGETGSHEWRARLFPLSVDGAILVASAVIYADARAKRHRDRLAYIVGGVGIVWSVGANIGHTWEHPAAKMMISAWPPIALAVCVELILRLIMRVREQSDRPTGRKAAPKVKAEPVKVTPEPVKIIAKPVKITAEPVATNIADDLRAAGWAPEDYPNATEAMVAYLDKVDSNIKGADLGRIVCEHFPVSGDYARKVVREYKAQLAAASQNGN